MDSIDALSRSRCRERRLNNSNIKDVLLGQKAVARETMMLASELKSHSADKLNDSAADGKTKLCLLDGETVNDEIEAKLTCRVVVVVPS